MPIYLGVVFLLDPTLGWLATGAAVALFLLTVVNEWGTVALLRRSSAAAIESQRRAESIVRNAEVIDSMGMMRAVARRWQEGVARAAPDQQRAADRAGWALGATKFVRLGAQIGVLGLGALLVLEQVMTPGAMIAASIIMGRALAPVEQMIGAWKQLVAARQSYRRLTAHLQAPRLRPPGLPLPEPTARLAADRVTYAFPGEPMATIKGVSFVLEPGESLAVIGPSGLMR